MHSDVVLAAGNQNVDRIGEPGQIIEVSTPKQRSEDVLRLQADGWKAMKLRAHEWTLKQDITQVEAVRKAAGDEGGDNLVLPADEMMLGNV